MRAFVENSKTAPPSAHTSVIRIPRFLSHLFQHPFTWKSLWRVQPGGVPGHCQKHDLSTQLIPPLTDALDDSVLCIVIEPLRIETLCWIVALPGDCPRQPLLARDALGKIQFLANPAAIGSQV